MSSFSRRTAMGGALGLLAAPAILHAQPAGGVKIGLVAVQTGPQAALGTQLRDGYLMGLRHLNGRLGGLTAETVMIDDELRPDVAVTKVRTALERDRCDFIVGVVFSNILQAIIRPVTDQHQCRAFHLCRARLQSVFLHHILQ